mgnify:CR=1 FL=1
MVCGQMDKFETVDMLTTLRRAVVKATCLMWDVSTDYFEPLARAVEKCDYWRVRMMAEADASIAATKAEILADQLVAMADQIDKYLQYLQEEAKHDSDTIQGNDRERGGSGGGVQG